MTYYKDDIIKLEELAKEVRTIKIYLENKYQPKRGSDDLVKTRIFYALIAAEELSKQLMSASQAVYGTLDRPTV